MCRGVDSINLSLSVSVAVIFIHSWEYWWVRFVTHATLVPLHGGYRIHSLAVNTMRYAYDPGCPNLVRLSIILIFICLDPPEWNISDWLAALEESQCRTLVELYSVRVALLLIGYI